MFWKENILSALGSKVLSETAGCQFQLDGKQWYYADITNRTQSDEKYVLTVEIPESVSGIITGIQLLGMGSVIGQRDEYIIKKSGKALMIKLKFQVYEGGN